MAQFFYVVHLIGRPESHIDVSREHSFHHCGIDRGVRVFLYPVPYVEQQGAAVQEHPPRLLEHAPSIRDEHDAETADDRAERAVAEGQRERIRLPPFDAFAVAELAPRIVQHGGAQVGRDDADVRIDAFAQPPRHEAGAAGDLQEVAGGPARKATHEVGRERVEPERADAVVVVRGSGKAGCGGVCQRYTLPGIVTPGLGGAGMISASMYARNVSESQCLRSSQYVGNAAMDL